MGGRKRAGILGYNSGYMGPSPPAVEKAHIKRGPLPRFSLLTLFLVTAIFAMTIALVLLWREVEPLRTRVHSLEVELGHLHVTDADRPSVISVRTDEPLTWKWRVFLPPLPHGKYHFNFFHGFYQRFTAENLAELLDRLRRQSPQHEFRNDNSVAVSGELTIEAKLVNREGHWFLVAQPFGETSTGFPEEWQATMKDLGLPARVQDENAWTEKANELAGVNPDRPMIFGRGDCVPLLLLQGPTIPIATSGVTTTGPAKLPAATIMLWIDYTP